MLPLCKITLCALMLSGCMPAEGRGTFFNGIPTISREEITVTIAAERDDCMGFAELQKCERLIFSNGTQETLSEGIAGYSHSDGVARRAVLEKVVFDTSKPDLLPMDISSIQYRFIRFSD